MELSSQLASDPPASSLDDLEIETPPGNDDSTTALSSEWAETIEARVDVLESALFDHATVLRDRVAERLDRLEKTLDLSQQRLEVNLSKESTFREEQIMALTETFTRALDRVNNASCPSQDPDALRPATTHTMEDLVDARALRLRRVSASCFS